MATLGGDRLSNIVRGLRRSPAQPDFTGRTGRPIEPIWILLAMALLSWSLVLGVIGLIEQLF